MTTTFKDVLWTIARRLGYDPATDAGWTAEVAPVTDLINKAYRMAWEHFPWRKLMTITGEAPAAHPSVTGAVYVAQETATRTLDYVESVWSADPRTNASASEVPFRMESDGVYFYTGHPSTVWIRYRDEVPEFTSTAWATSTAYVAGDLVYRSDDGNVYVCLEGHTSGTFATDLAAEKWQVVPVYKFLKQAVIEGVLAFKKEDRGETGRARLAMAETVRDELEHELMQERRVLG